MYAASIGIVGLKVRNGVLTFSGRLFTNLAGLVGVWLSLAGG